MRATTPSILTGTPRRVRVAVAAVVLALHLVVLYSPRAPSVGSGVRLDLVVHVVVFAALALTARWAGLGPRVLALALVAEALLSETVQALWLPGRSGDPTDLLADAVGTATGLWGWVAAARRSQRVASARA